MARRKITIVRTKCFRCDKWHDHTIYVELKDNMFVMVAVCTNCDEERDYKG